MNDLVKFNLDELKERTRQTVQASFGALIPDEAFKTLVDAAIKEFFETPVFYRTEPVYKENSSSYYRNQEKIGEQLSVSITPFKRMVWDYLTEVTKERLNKVFEDKQHKVQEHIKNMFDTPEIHKLIDLNVVALGSKITEIRNAQAVDYALGTLKFNLSQLFSVTPDFEALQSMLRDNPLAFDTEVENRIKQTWKF